ncbi:ERF family protein [Gordonibacter pamelaeae]|uniref:ERF family protein n=1 Tax=Gordonibacter pamelaeae TaxID=471189 RepID=UPI003A932284
MDKLIEVQAALKAPKGQFNKFGGYAYRSCEDILEAVKPLLAERGMQLTLTDEPVEVGGRVYIRATATVEDGSASVSASAYAREAEAKKGMDESQVTGTASSYARKYALNGLFLIDDTKDADATNRHGAAAKPARKPAAKPDPVSAAKQRLWAAVKAYAAERGADPKAVIQDIEKRPDAKMSDPAWLSAVAVEFEAGGAA